MQLKCFVNGCRYPVTAKVPKCPKHQKDVYTVENQPKVEPVIIPPIAPPPTTIRIRKATAFKDGGLYVILFSTGMVKIGCSKEPRTRVREHTQDAWCYGIDTLDSWCGPVRPDILPCEAALANAVALFASESRAREYFRGVDFNHAVDLAKQAYQDHQPR